MIFDFVKKVAHNFGKSDNDIIQWENAYFQQTYTWFHAQLAQTILDGLISLFHPLIICITQIFTLQILFECWISSEKYWYYFQSQKMCCVLSLALYFEFSRPWTLQCSQSADSKQNAISKYLFQDSFWLIFWTIRKMHHTF